MFELDTRLAEATSEIGDLNLCRVLLMNDRAVPWLLLVPMREKISEMYQLNKKERGFLIEEINLATEVMERLYHPHKLNVGMLGNLVNQMHVHVICRFEQDRAWPNSIWNTTPIQPYSEDEMKSMRASFRKGFGISQGQ